MADASTASDLSLWIPFFAGAVASPALTAVWITVPDLRRRRRLLRLAEVWRPLPEHPSRSETMLGDMLESEIELLWWQREYANWRSHDPKLLYDIPSRAWFFTVLVVFGLLDIQVFLQQGPSPGIFACLLTVFIWYVPAAIVSVRGRRRNERRLMRGNVPRTAEQIAELRALQQGNALRAPSRQVLKEWLRSHIIHEDTWRRMQENSSRSLNDRIDAYRTMNKWELEKQERIRILLQPAKDPHNPGSG